MHKRKRSQKIGTLPGSLIFVGTKKENPPRISLFNYATEDFQEKHISNIKECFPYLKDPSPKWLHICNHFETSTIKALGKELLWHPLLQEDILFTGQRPKLDDYGNCLYVSLRMLLLDAQTNELNDEQVSLIFNNNYLVSFTESDNHTFDHIRKELCNKESTLRTMNPDYLCYAIMDSIVDHYFLVIEKVDEQLMEMEKQLFLPNSQRLLHHILKKKREVNAFRRHIWPLREIIHAFQRNESSLIKSNTKVYIRDLYDHTIQSIEMIEGVRDVADDMIEIHISNVNQRLNQIMTFLTVIATIFVPLTFIASIYGMNFKYMPELEWRWGYPMVLGGMLFITLGMLFYFRKKKWQV